MDVSFEKIKEAVKRMGAEGADPGPPINFAPKKDRPRPTPVTFTIKTRQDWDKIKEVGGVLVDEHGRRIVVHIRDYYVKNRSDALDAFMNDIEARPKFHVTECETIAEMRRAGRFDKRYGVHYNPDGLFVVSPTERGGTWISDEKLRLRPCRNCLKKLGYQGYPPFVYPVWWRFATKGMKEKWLKPRRRALALAIGTDPQAFKAFIDIYSFTEDPPIYTTETMPENKYTSDWPRISERVRNKAHWTCQQCGVVISQDLREALHVHHKNGMRNDNSSSNLVVLCALCHQQQPRHGHMFVSERARDGIEKRRSEQDIHV
ncbi:MAG: HNH endonuclease [Alphaproteobacteria bacterium GM7ARS4]|nr:HNH endonuclease [Alphaproteobacteria bacterium GM7ARS4]